MKIAVLIQCHKNAKQINLLLNKLNHPDIDCYLHIDKKAYFEEQIVHRKKKKMSLFFQKKSAFQ